MSLLLRALALTYIQTDDSKYLDSIRRLASLRRDAIEAGTEEVEEGSVSMGRSGGLDRRYVQ